MYLTVLVKMVTKYIKNLRQNLLEFAEKVYDEEQKNVLNSRNFCDKPRKIPNIDNKLGIDKDLC